MIKFEPGVAYHFKACFGFGSDAQSFLAVAADRTGREVDFVVPVDVLSARPKVIDGRETISVVRDGLAYFASAATPAEIGESFNLLAQIRETRSSCATRY